MFTPNPLPYIDDYAATCARHPSFEQGYQQWLTVVHAWGYTGDEGDWLLAYKRMTGLA